MHVCKKNYKLVFKFFKHIYQELHISVSRMILSENALEINFLRGRLSSILTQNSEKLL